MMWSVLADSKNSKFAKGFTISNHEQGENRRDIGCDGYEDGGEKFKWKLKGRVKEQREEFVSREKRGIRRYIRMRK